jgi:uncharacterized membrane-anchored protein
MYGPKSCISFCVAACALLLVASSPASAQDDRLLKELNSLPWVVFPSVGNIGTVARINLTNDLRFLDDVNTRRFLELNGNPPRNNNFTLAPRSMSWFAVFTFDRSGYVKDDERLNPDELLKSLKEQNAASIEERRRLNLPILKLDGWAVSPHYDTETRRLEWGTRLLGDRGDVVVNYTIRILGRSGVMSAILVSDPQELNEDVRQFKTALRGFDFVQGERYSEFRQGDRVAEYGLAALIIGGAAAAAAKSGAFKGFAKIIGIAVIGGLIAIGGFFARLFRRS